MLPENTILLGCCDMENVSGIIQGVSALGYMLCGLAMDGEHLLQLIAEHQPDIVMMDIIMPVYDARAVIERIPCLPVSRFPRLVVMMTPGMKRMCDMLPVGSVVFYDKTSDPGGLAATLREALNITRLHSDNRHELTENIKRTLIELGVFPKVRGFYYLTDAIIMFIDKYGHLNNLGDDIYKPLADRYCTRPANIERSMRSAIEGAWARPANMAAQLRNFGNTIDSNRGKPTNAEFIARIAEKMLHGGSYEPLE